MAILTKSKSRISKNLEFDDIVEVPRSHCVIVSAIDKRTGKSHAFIIFRSSHKQ